MRFDDGCGTSTPINQYDLSEEWSRAALAVENRMFLFGSVMAPLRIQFLHLSWPAPVCPSTLLPAETFWTTASSTPGRPWPAAPDRISCRRLRISESESAAGRTAPAAQLWHGPGHLQRESSPQPDLGIRHHEIRRLRVAVRAPVGGGGPWRRRLWRFWRRPGRGWRSLWRHFHRTPL